MRLVSRMRERPSAEVNSVMMRPQPECSLVVSVSTSTGCAGLENMLAFLMKRRKTVSVTPAMGASTVAGAMRTPPMCSSAGTRAVCGMARAAVMAELSHSFFM